MKRRPLFIIAITLMFGLLTSHVDATTVDDCVGVRGFGETFATGPGTFQGNATLETKTGVENASVVTNLLGPPTPGDDGTLHASTSHTFVLEDGSSFTTLDNAVLSPTDTPGLYNLNTRAAIVSGTGTHTDSCGRLSIHGTIDLINGEVVWRFTGRICDCG